MMRLIINPVFWLIWVAVFLISCEQTEQQAPVKEVVRPVKTMLLKSPEAGDSRPYPGKVHASQKAVLTFKVQGNP